MRVRNVAVRELARRADVEHEESGRALPEPERIGGFDVLVGRAAEDRRALGRLSGGNCGEMRPRHAEAALEARPHVVEAPSERADLADALLERAEPPRQTPSGDCDAGGGCAEEAVVDEGSVLSVRDGMAIEEAGGFPEVFLAAFSNLFMPRVGDLAPGETALVHGGGGGVGTAGILLLREAGHRAIVTAGSPAKGRRCEELGATAAIDYRTEDIGGRARELTGGPRGE